MPVKKATYQAIADRGLSPLEAAKELRVTHSTILKAAKRHGIKFNVKPRKDSKND